MNKRVELLCRNPVFQAFTSELDEIGVQLGGRHNGAQGFAVFSARSTARWWLVPLSSGAVASSGLAMFQPLFRGPQILKVSAMGLAFVRLHQLWPVPRIHLRGSPVFAELFSGAVKRFAYFTGTCGPHRKSAVQVMDGNGRILGFAKVSAGAPAVDLLVHEAEVLNQICGLTMTSASVPNVIGVVRTPRGVVLATDTEKTSRSQSSNSLGRQHLEFLMELQEKTAIREPFTSGEEAHVDLGLLKRLHDLHPSWKELLDESEHLFSGDAGQIPLARATSHGDFTPWNTFDAGGRLYVFDWEYSVAAAPVSRDLVHFMLNEPVVRSLPADMQIREIVKRLDQLQYKGIVGRVAAAHVLMYFAALVRHRAMRARAVPNSPGAWDDEAKLYLLMREAIRFARRAFAGQMRPQS